MKKNRILKIGLLALALTLVTASLVSGTFAKYVTTVTGTGTVTVAKWNATLTNNSITYGPTSPAGTINFKLFDTTGDTGLIDGTYVAPGTGGSFKFDWTTAGSQVDRTVSLKVNVGNIPTKSNIVFSLDSEFSTTLVPDSNNDLVLADNVLLQANATDLASAGSSTVYWRWLFENSVDADDTAHGISDFGNYPLTATFTATQVD